MNTPAEDGYYMPPDWGPHEQCWMAWPCRLSAWGESIDHACLATAAVARAIVKYEPVSILVPPHLVPVARLQLGSKITIIETELDDSWARDIAPNFLIDDNGGLAGAVFEFNAWGNKFNNYSNDANLGKRMLKELHLPLYQIPMTSEGGSIHVDGSGTLITTESATLNTNRNPTLDKRQIEERLAMFFGVRKVIWLPEGLIGDGADGQVNKVARFISPGRIMCAIAAEKSDPNYANLSDNLFNLQKEHDALGQPLNIIELPLPAPLHGADGQYLARSYLDFYLGMGAVIVPAFDDVLDKRAAKLIGAAFPDREVVQLDMSEVSHRGRSIHCMTQQQPKVREAR